VAKENVPPAIKQYKKQGNSSNLVQSYFGSPQLKRLESGNAPLVPRGFDPACWGLYQLLPSLMIPQYLFNWIDFAFCYFIRLNEAKHWHTVWPENFNRSLGSDF